jgi:hypothetical protein
MDDYENDYDRIARAMDEALGAFTGNAHEYSVGDSITMTKDGFIAGVIRFQRLRDYVEGLADVYHKAAMAKQVEAVRDEIKDAMNQVMTAKDA